LWQILADFVADFVAESTKPLDYQEVLEANARCGRDWLRRTLSYHGLPGQTKTKMLL